MNRKFVSLALISFILSSCNLIWIAPVGVISTVKSGDRDVVFQDKYWQSVQKNKLYELVEPVEYSDQVASEHMDYYLYGSNAENQQRNPQLPQGTLLEPVTIHYKSDGLNYAFIDYIAIIRSGEHEGKRVAINGILSRVGSDKIYQIDPSYLRLVSD